MTPKQFQEIETVVRGCISRLDQMLCDIRQKANEIPPIEKLRRATPQDITIGNVIWYHNDGDGWYWREVEEVHYPNDDWKAYSSNGDRYGLWQAWVEI
jgi:hypothetical protein